MLWSGPEREGESILTDGRSSTPYTGWFRFATFEDSSFFDVDG
jgi:hypothetical protein